MSLSAGQLYERSGLGIFTRLIGIFLLISLPLFAFTPELFPDLSIHGYDVLEVPLSKINIKARFIIAIIVGLQQLILVVGLFAMARIFDLLTSQQWFLPDLSYNLKTFGISLIVFVISTPVVNALLVITMGLEVFYNASDYEKKDLIFSFSISSQGLLIILVGILLILLAKVLGKANENAHELEEIV